MSFSPAPRVIGDQTIIVLLLNQQTCWGNAQFPQKRFQVLWLVSEYMQDPQRFYSNPSQRKEESFTLNKHQRPLTRLDLRTVQQMEEKRDISQRRHSSRVATAVLFVLMHALLQKLLLFLLYHLTFFPGSESQTHTCITCHLRTPSTSLCLGWELIHFGSPHPKYPSSHLEGGCWRRRSGSSRLLFHSTKPAWLTINHLAVGYLTTACISKQQWMQCLSLCRCRNTSSIRLQSTASTINTVQ